MLDKDRRALQWVIKTAQNITGTYLLSIGDIGEVRCPHRPSPPPEPQPAPFFNFVTA